MPESAPSTAAAVPEGLLQRIRQVVGHNGYVEDPAGIDAYMHDWRGLYVGRTPLVVRPASTAELAEVVRLCAEARVPVVPQAGNTSMAGGAVPFEAGNEILISVSRMNRIRDLDPANLTMTVEAGCVLARIQAAAEEVGCLFPLSLASEGSCQIGGNLSTNAGGNNTLRYGNARDLVLGLEVVLPDGQVWDGLRRLRKDNTGYGLKHLFIGAEGTLGIIAAAVLKLVPKPRDRQIAMAAVRDVKAALDLLNRLQATDGESISAFEYIPRIGIEMVTRYVEGTSDPFAKPYQHYVLVELASARPDAGLRESLENGLAAAMEDGLVLDAVLAESAAQGKQLWRLREELSDAQKFEGGSIKNDISVPVSQVPAFMERAIAAVKAAMPEIRPVPFGHVGDGNIHFNLTQPKGMDKAAFLAQWDRFADMVNEIVAEMGGSFAAEHGVGRLKRKTLERYRGGVEIELMRKIKAAIDPHNLMNPGKVV